MSAQSDESLAGRIERFRPVVELGYQLSSEEHPARDLVGYACRAEETGFSYAQGQAPFVWAVVGAIAQATKRLRLGTAVTAPIRRTPPHLVAHAAATVATLRPGRFFLGVGTGENLNEHVGRGGPGSVLPLLPRRDPAARAGALARR